MKNTGLLIRTIIILAVTVIGIYLVIGPRGRSISAEDFSWQGIKNNVANNINGKTLCAFGDAAATPALTTLKHFRHEFEAHVREGRCTLHADWRAHQPVGAH